MRRVQGDSYRVDIQHGVMVVEVWRRPDLDSKRGAQLMKEMAGYLEAFLEEPTTGAPPLGPRRRTGGPEAPLTNGGAGGPVSGARGAIVDFRRGPPVTGPVTQGTLGGWLAAWEKAGRRVGIVADPEVATQSMQMKRLVKEHAPTVGKVVPTLEEAWAWVGTQ